MIRGKSPDTIPVAVEFRKAIVYHNQAQFHPTKYVSGLARAFEAAGGVILQHCFIENVTEKDPLLIESSLGLIKGRNLIWATHIPPRHQPAAFQKCTLSQLCHCRNLKGQQLSRPPVVRHV